MKFFAALIAKLTGQAEAPKTLEQARATFGEAKTALDKVAAMFAAAALDFDALLTSGDNSLRDHIAAIQGKATTAEAALVEANGKVAAAEAKVSEAEGKLSGLRSQVSGLEGLFSAVGFKPEATAKAEDLQKAWNTHIASAATQKLAELGVKAAALPAAAAHDEAVSADDLRAQLAASSDPAERGKIAAKLNKLRDTELTGKN